jgi:hypothetical protein
MPAAQDPLNDVLEGGYVTSGEWHGPAWAITYGENATIDPESFVDHPAGEPLCISGYIEPTEDFSNGAILGFNVNQSPEVDSTPLTVVPTGNGLYVNLTNHAGSEIRAQIHDLEGEDEDHRWCTVLYELPTVIPWSDFNTRCWDNSGASGEGGATGEGGA